MNKRDYFSINNLFENSLSMEGQLNGWMEGQIDRWMKEHRRWMKGQKDR
jgi:hypothetical protein